MHFIYVRHGLTQNALDKKFSGHSDVPVIDLKTEKLATAIDLLNLHKPNLLIYSPLLRAKQTAEYLCSKYIFSEIVEEQLLIERCFGFMEGKEKNPENRHKIETDITAESIICFELRVRKFVETYRLKNQNIAIVGHSAFYKKLIEILRLQINEIDCSGSRLIKLD